MKDQNGVTEVVCCMREDGEVVMCQAPVGSCCSYCPFSRQSLVVFHWHSGVGSVCLSFIYFLGGLESRSRRGAQSPAVGVLPIGGLSRVMLSCGVWCSQPHAGHEEQRVGKSWNDFSFSFVIVCISWLGSPPIFWSQCLFFVSRTSRLPWVSTDDEFSSSPPSQTKRKQLSEAVYLIAFTLLHSGRVAAHRQPAGFGQKQSLVPGLLPSGHSLAFCFAAMDVVEASPSSPLST